MSRVAALANGESITFYDYTGIAPPYNGIPHRGLRNMRCHVLRTVEEDETRYLVPLKGEGLLETVVSHSSKHLFEGVAVDAMLVYLIAVHRGLKKKVPGCTTALHAVPCFVEDGILFTQIEMEVGSKVKMMR
jgi:hypothetical protein